MKPSTKPRLFTTIWTNAKGEFKYFTTDSEDAALKAKVRRNGEVYIDTRYAAKLRLYNYMMRKSL